MTTGLRSWCRCGSALFSDKRQPERHREHGDEDRGSIAQRLFGPLGRPRMRLSERIATSCRQAAMSKSNSPESDQYDTGLLLVAHGSRERVGRDEFFATARLVAQWAGGVPVEACFLE